MQTLDARKERILETTIGEYIHTAEPVGSKAVAELEGLKVSPATVRNEMAVLEELGYLTQPHTSAGRIPTDLGYRYYVDSYAGRLGLSESEETRVADTLAEIKAREIEEVMRGISAALSNLTCYVSVVLGPPAKRHVYFWGVSAILHQPEFLDVHRVEDLLEVLEQEYSLIDVLMEDMEDMEEPVVHARIGSENKRRELSGLSLILAGYGDDREPLGTLGILGPTRMDYVSTMPVVDFTAKRLSSLLAGLLG